MNSNLTHITVILDRSGSMSAIRQATIDGFNAFLEEQMDQPGLAALTLVQFDSQNPHEVVHHARPIERIPHLTRATFVPRGNTPLYDALGYAIRDLEKQLVSAPPPHRPSKVLVAVLTDGQENSSREFTKAQITGMIQEKSKCDWQFLFLCSELEAVRDARTIGVPISMILHFDKSNRGIRHSFSTLSTGLTKFRTGASGEFDLRSAERETPAS